MSIQIHLTEADEDLLQDKADLAGLSIQQYAFRLIQADLGTQWAPPPPETKAEDPAIEVEMITRVHSMPEGRFSGIVRDAKARDDR